VLKIQHFLKHNHFCIEWSLYVSKNHYESPEFHVPEKWACFLLMFQVWVLILAILWVFKVFLCSTELIDLRDSFKTYTFFKTLFLFLDNFETSFYLCIKYCV